MGLNAVQTFVQDTLNGLIPPGQNGQPIRAYIAPPSSVPTGTGAVAFVWGSTIQGKRQTAPRVQGQGTGGYMKYIYTPDIWIYQEMIPDAPNADVQFPLLLDAVIGALLAVKVPQFLTDPVTGATSQLLAIGETIGVGMNPVRATEDERIYLYQGNVRPTVEEAIVQ